MIKPSLLLIMETEIWPNLIRAAEKKDIPVAIVNGRISDESFKGYQRLKFLLKSVLKNVDLFCMQTQESGQRIIDIGAPVERVHICGNIKFDISWDQKTSKVFTTIQKALGGGSLFIAGSTHENEEEMIVDFYASLHKDFKGLRLLIAPRHLERIDRIRRMVRVKGLEAVLASRAREFLPGQVMLLDTIGDLGSLYALCQLAFIGGSLVRKGGHNLIEAAMFAKPILTGPYMHNFREIQKVFLKEGAAIQVQDARELEYEVRRLLSSDSAAKELGVKAQEILEENRGAAERTMKLLEPILGL